MSSIDGAIASIRFGMGARPGEIARRSADPAGSLLADFDSSGGIDGLFAQRPGSAKLVRAFFKAKDEGGDRSIIRLFRNEFRQAYIDEATLRTEAAVLSRSGFRERMVQFWSNHFTVSARRAITAGLAGPYEREAIRPHVNGRFADMLLAVVRHPAMILYLDNALSIGPNSVAGKRIGKGMNENLAREILELHTLGVDGGYDQEDVNSLALMLTGWSLGRRNRRGEKLGEFHFHEYAHEPGAQTLLGKRYADDGEAQAEAALRDLARHPATVRHVVTKLLRHLVADEPDPADIDRVVAVWNDSDGDLMAVHAAILKLEKAWQPLTKLKTPNEVLVSSLRALGVRKVQPWVVGAMDLLGQAPWNAPSPKGWADRAHDWLNADLVMRRIEFASALAGRMPDAPMALEVARTAMGPLSGRDTEDSISRAESQDQALALALSAPEFQRR